MKIVVVGSNLPTVSHSGRGSTLVTRSLLGELRNLGNDVAFQPLMPLERDPNVSAEEQQGMDALAELGVTVLPLLRTPAARRYPGRRGFARIAVTAPPEAFNPGYLLRDEMAGRVAGEEAELVIHLWSPPALAACCTVDAPVFAYYGNPDHKPFEALYGNPGLFGIPHGTVRDRARIAMNLLVNRTRRRVNVALMQTTAWSANVCAVDASFYSDHGHPNAFYIQNMWPDLHGEPGSSSFADGENRIVGSLGRLDATGNTFGLWYLAREVIPQLDRRLGSSYGVHLFGGSRPAAALDGLLRHQCIHVRGYVDDIDAEMRAAKIFLITNNTNEDFIVGHTRVLHAWSLGMCLVGHRNMSRAMPEVVHGENALLGSSGEEIAEHVATALADAELRESIGRGGRLTYEREFVPETVVRRVVARVAEARTAR